MNKFNTGDIVLLARGRKTNFYEVIKTEEDYYWITDGWVQIKVNFNDMELICKEGDRQDKKVPFMRYIK